jgi:hypothetical protein
MANVNYRNVPQGKVQDHIKMKGDVVMLSDGDITAKYSVTLEYNEINCFGGTVTAPDIYLKENTEVMGDCLHGNIHYGDSEL